MTSHAGPGKLRRKENGEPYIHCPNLLTRGITQPSANDWYPIMHGDTDLDLEIVLVYIRYNNVWICCGVPYGKRTITALRRVIKNPLKVGFKTNFNIFIIEWSPIHMNGCRTMI